MLAERYIAWVQEIIKKYSDMTNMMQDDTEILSPAQINSSLAYYLEISMTIASEYRRKAIELYDLEQNYLKWYNPLYKSIRKKMIGEMPKSIKLSVKEIDNEFQTEYSIEYWNWQDKIKEIQSQLDFLTDVKEQVKKWDNILCSLANNMRAEMKSLKIENRMNYNPERKIVEEKSFLEERQELDDR
jgi:predicted RNase H-like nuclease